MSNLQKVHRTVLFLTTDRQIDRRILQQADSLDKAGWIVSILAMPPDQTSMQDDPRVVRIRLASKKVGLTRYCLLMLYKAIRKCIPMHSFVMHQFKKIAWKYFANQEYFYLDLFSNELINYNPHVVVAVDLPMLPVGISLSRRTGARLVYDSHELYTEQIFSSYEKQKWEKIESKYIQHCDAVITVNRSIASELEQRYNLPKVNIIHNAIPLFQSSANKNRIFHSTFLLSNNRKILLYQGGLSKGRHLEMLVTAMAYVQNSLVDLVILGEGQLVSLLQKMTRSLKIQNRVYFHPAVSQNTLLEYTQSADAGIIPYQATCLNHYYCTPNKLFEFIAAGIPILGPNLPEIQNIVDKYNFGLTGDMSSPNELANLIDQFFSNQSLIEQWKRNIQLNQNAFSWEVEERTLLSIFREFE